MRLCCSPLSTPLRVLCVCVCLTVPRLHGEFAELPELAADAGVLRAPEITKQRHRKGGARGDEGSDTQRVHEQCTSRQQARLSLRRVSRSCTVQVSAARDDERAPRPWPISHAQTPTNQSGDHRVRGTSVWRPLLWHWQLALSVSSVRNSPRYCSSVGTQLARSLEPAAGHSILRQPARPRGQTSDG
jgi:hypothetical protein